MSSLIKAKGLFFFIFFSMALFIPLILALLSLLFNFTLHLIWNLKRRLEWERLQDQDERIDYWAPLIHDKNEKENTREREQEEQDEQDEQDKQGENESDIFGNSIINYRFNYQEDN